MTPPDAPRGTSADAAGSIRDRLKAPASTSEASSGGDSSMSGTTDASFQQTDSAATLAARGRSDQQESSAAGVEGGPGHRPVDLDPREQRKAERKIAALFLLSVLSVIAFVLWYFLAEQTFGRPGNTAYTPVLGVLLMLALFGIGAGTVLWGKTLMVHEQAVQERHPFGSTDEERAEAAALLAKGLDDAGVKRRPLLLGTLALAGGALALLPLPFVFGLGRYQNKERALAETAWRKGMRLYRSNGTAVRIGDLQLGAVESVFPNIELPQLRADSPVLLIRMRPEELVVGEGRENWSVDGHIAYSSICTHLGCPVKLYEQQTNNLFCPCHQSTFDASRGARVLFGPAARPLPQLAISLDAEGYFVAQGDFAEPIGPSYWERDS